MKIYSWNVNGIRAAEKKGFLDWLNAANADVICLQETKAHEEQLSKEILESHGYHTIWHSAEKRGYSSVSTFCKNKPLYEQKGLGIEKFDREGRVIITEHENFLLYNIYFKIYINIIYIEYMPCISPLCLYFFYLRKKIKNNYRDN